MVDEARVRTVLSRMAVQFRNDRQAPAGWGQFLNLPRQHHQVGPYGTAAGLIVLSLASPELELLPEEKILLHEFWEDWKTKYNRCGRKFVQNIRLAFLYLALRLSGHDDLNQLTQEIEAELRHRQLTNHLWGNWFLSDTDKDYSESIFVSAIVVLAFSLPKDHYCDIPGEIVQAAKALQERAVTDKNLSESELMSSLAAAVWALPQREIQESVRNKIRRHAGSSEVLYRQRLQFFDFQYLSEGNRKFGRDYFVVPGGVFESLMIRNRYCSYVDLLAREHILEHFLNTLEDNQAKYVIRGESLAATVNQAWVGLALHVGRLDRVVAIPIQYHLIDWLRKPRPDTIFWRLVMPIGAALVFISGTLEPRLFTEWVPGQLYQLFASAGTPLPTPAAIRSTELDRVDWFVKVVMFFLTGLFGADLYRIVRAKISGLLHRD